MPQQVSKMKDKIVHMRICADVGDSEEFSQKQWDRNQ